MNNKYLELKKKISEYGTIIIHRHSRPDGDAIGSQIGLKEAIKATYPYKKVYVVGDTTEKFMFLGEMDNISDDVYNQALAIVVDSGDEYLISDDRYKLARCIIKIDHHIAKAKWDCAALEIVESDEVSCASMIADIIFKLSFKLTDLGAKALFTGIVTDSGRFRYEGTNDKVFEIVAKLVKYNFNLDDVYSKIYVEDLEVVKLRASLTSKFVLSEGGVAYLMNTQEDIKNYKTDVFTISRGMVGIMSGIKGINVWANFTEDENGKVIAELRCTSKYNVNAIAVKWGGGGHKQASGATIANFEAAKAMIKDLEALLKENNDGN